MKTALIAAAIAAALLVGGLVLTFAPDEMKLEVALEPLLPPATKIANTLPGHITFTLSGPKAAVEQQKAKIKFPIRPDLRHTTSPTIALRVTQDYLGELVDGVQVTSISPSNVTIELQDL